MSFCTWLLGWNSDHSSGLPGCGVLPKCWNRHRSHCCMGRMIYEACAWYRESGAEVNSSATVLKSHFAYYFWASAFMNTSQLCLCRLNLPMLYLKNYMWDAIWSKWDYLVIFPQMHTSVCSHIKTNRQHNQISNSIKAHTDKSGQWSFVSPPSTLYIHSSSACEIQIYFVATAAEAKDLRPQVQRSPEKSTPFMQKNAFIFNI